MQTYYWYCRYCEKQQRIQCVELHSLQNLILWSAKDGDFFPCGELPLSTHCHFFSEFELIFNNNFTPHKTEKMTHGRPTILFKYHLQNTTLLQKLLKYVLEQKMRKKVPEEYLHLWEKSLKQRALLSLIF